MKNYTAQAFVRVQNYGKQFTNLNLQSKLKELGYTQGLWYREDDNTHIAINAGKLTHVNMDLDTMTVDPDGFIDCGTNTALFLELAKMRDDVAEGQWFRCVVPYEDDGMDNKKFICGDFAKPDNFNGIGGETSWFNEPKMGMVNVPRFHEGEILFYERDYLPLESTEYKFEPLEALWERATPQEVAENWETIKHLK